MTRHIVSFSTGIPSAIVAYLVCKEHPDAIVLFADVLIEDDDNYRFLGDVESLLGKRVVRITGNQTPLEIAENESDTWIPNHRTATCTRKGKIQVIKTFMQEGDMLYIGMTHRDKANGRKLEAPINNWNKVGVTVKYPLIEQNIEPFTLANELGLVAPRMYNMGYSHANCGGCCVKQGRRDWSLTLKMFPERYAQYEKWEHERITKQLAKDGKLYTFVRKIEDGQNIGLSLKELREEIESKESSNMNFFQLVDEMNGYGCTVECGIGSEDELSAVFD